MLKNKFMVIGVVAAMLISCKNTKGVSPIGEPSKPNIVFIYMDDLGYGDISAYGAQAIQTPNIDRLAKGGVQFTNGYASSATCTPSRYALLTGSYPWRNKKAKILPGTAPLLIKEDQMTLPKMLQANGYETAVVGKWHLGLGEGFVDWNQPIKPGPNEVGFDYSFIMAATQDRVPTVYIKNGNVHNLDKNDPIYVSYEKNFEGEPTGKNAPQLLKMIGDPQHNKTIVNGVPRIGYMKGGQSARWIDEDMADTFLGEAQAFVRRKKDKPFFLYYGMQQPHVPRTPHPRFVGATNLGPRGDVIAEADWCVGEFIKTLEKEGLLENTLIFLSSDNGPVLDDGYKDEAIEKLGNHQPTGGLRGGKYSLFEAGTRVPFITYWKGKIKPAVSNAVVSQLDWFSSIASLIGGESTSQDSQNMMAEFLGESQKGRENLVIEATSRTAFRKGDWLMIPPYKGTKFLKSKGIETGSSRAYQLYNLKADFAQKENLAKVNTAVLDEMKSDFKKIRGESHKEISQIKFEN